MMTPRDAWTGAEIVLDESACPICLHESCEGHDEREAPQPQAPTRPPRWQLAAAAIAAPTPDPIIDGIAWSDALSVMVGESAAGKTFVLLDIAATVSAGLRWHGRDVQQGSVIYISYEGYVGLRLRALRDVQGQRLEHVYIIRASDPLSPIIDRDRVELPSRGEVDVGRDIDEIVAHVTAAGLPPVRLLQIDTVRASLSGSEDSSEAVSAYLRAVRRLMARAPGAAALLAHHAGWQDGETRKKRERGSSAFRGNVDGTLYLETSDYDAEHGEARLTLSTIKVRDGETRPPLHMIRRRVEIPGLADRWGQPVTSCIIERDRRSREDREAEQAQAAETAHRETDIAVLRVVAEQPALATSQDHIRVALSGKRDLVYAAVTRLVRRGWMLPPERQRQPYTVTAEGQTVIREATP